MKRRMMLAAVLVGAMATSLAGCGSSTPPATSSNAAGGTLVLDNSFDLKSADPNREYSPTGSIVSKAIYETLLTYAGTDTTKVVGGLADLEFSSDFKTLKLTMKDGHKFSDGSPVTVDDAVYSLKRLQGVNGNASFLLKDIVVTKTDDKTLTLTATAPTPQLPAILTNTSTAVVNSKVLKANGGTEDANDKAEAFLAKTSAGSGPYKLEAFDAATQVTMVRNENYAGTKPKFDRIVLRNVIGATQQLNVQQGSSQIALDLSATQASQLDTGKVGVNAQPSPTTVFLFFNQDPAVSPLTANPKLVQAARNAIDYAKLVTLSGSGSRQAAGIIPEQMLGGLKSDPTNTFDLDKAKAGVAASGYKGEEIKLSYANDLTVQGIELQTFAEAIQAQLKAAGINVKLAPSPVATELDAYRGGKEQIGLWYWNPDYYDPANYLVFAPGGKVGLRAGWKADASPTATAALDAARAASGDARSPAMEAFQKALNSDGPFIPLVQPAKSVAYNKALTELGLSPVWTIDVGAVK